MSKVRCNFENCDYCKEGICNRGSISLYYGECNSMRISHDPDAYDDYDE